MCLTSYTNLQHVQFGSPKFKKRWPVDSEVDLDLQFIENSWLVIRPGVIVIVHVIVI